jgi:hypothetical protein
MYCTYCTYRYSSGFQVEQFSLSGFLNGAALCTYHIHSFIQINRRNAIRVGFAPCATVRAPRWRPERTGAVRGPLDTFEGLGSPYWYHIWYIDNKHNNMD